MGKGTAESVRLTTSQAVVRYLQVQYSEFDGVRQRLVAAMLGIFGHGNVAGIGQALDECGQDLPYHQTRHEQAMVHMAAGYAKASGRTSTLACTASIGPGATNMITGAAAATINRLPVLLLPADYYATRAQGPVLQQLEHPIEADVSVSDCFRPVSRFFDRISRPEQVLASLPEAMRVLTNPAETGAVTIALPQDVGSHAYDYPLHFFEQRTWIIDRPPPPPERLDAAWEAISRAERPIIIAGGGIHYSRALDDLERFSAATGIPVAETFAGKGAMQRRSWRQLGGIGATGNPAANALAREADLVICIGTRLTDFPTASQSLFQDPGVRFVAINVTAKDAAKQHGLAVVGDAQVALRGLHDRAVVAGWHVGESLERTASSQLAAWHHDRAIALSSHPTDPGLTQGQLIGVLNDHAEDGDVIVAAAGGPPGDLLRTWDATGGRFAHIEFGFSCMTYEIPAGIGVRMAKADGEIIVFIGDGTYLMNPSELVTAVQEDRKITVVIAENHGFQSIRGLQVERTGREFGTEFRRRSSEDGRLTGQYLSLDLAATARGFGARVWNVTDPAELRAALKEARAETAPCVIVAEVDPHHSLPDSGAWLDVEPAEVSGLEDVRRVRTEYEENKASLQRFYY